MEGAVEVRHDGGGLVDNAYIANTAVNLVHLIIAVDLIFAKDVGPNEAVCVPKGARAIACFDFARIY